MIMTKFVTSCGNDRLGRRNLLKQKDFISFDNLEFHPQSPLK